MIQLIMPDRYAEFSDELAEMHRLRYRVFKKRLDWNVDVRGDMEIDTFDAVPPAYLLLRGWGRGIQGCVRLLPTTGPTMLRDAFYGLLKEHPAPVSPVIWESSRFALDVSPDTPNLVGRLATATYELLAGMIEFGLSQGLQQIVTVTDVRMERILRRAAWPLERISEPRTLGTTLAVAGYLDVSTKSLMRVRRAGNLSGPVLWAPVAPPTSRRLNS